MLEHALRSGKPGNLANCELQSYYELYVLEAVFKMEVKSNWGIYPVPRRGAGKRWIAMAGEDRVTRGPHCHAEKIVKALMTALVIASLGLVGTIPAAPAQGLGQSQGSLTQSPLQSRFPNPAPNFPKRTRKQKQALLDRNFKKLKQNAKDLAELATSLQAEIEKTNENVLSLEIVKKAERAEKLAKQIKEEAKGY